MTDLEILQATKTKLLQRQSELFDELLPDHSEGDQSLQWVNLMAEIRAQLKEIDEQIAKASGPYEIRSYGY